jgi:hypothetical protein
MVDEVTPHPVQIYIRCSGNRGLKRRAELPNDRRARQKLDYSDVGLAATSAFGLPDTFELHAPGRKYQVMVIHHGFGHVGLKFV